MKYNQYRIPSPESALINGTLKLKPGSDYLGEEFNIFTKYTLNNNWQFVFLLGIFNPKDVQFINNKNSKTAIQFSFQFQYNYKIFIL